MKLVRFYGKGELSSIRITSEEETVSEVKNFFFNEQLVEEQIMLEIYSQNLGIISVVDELRLDFDRIHTGKQLRKKGFFSGCKLVDSSNYNEEFSMETIISIKNEQRYLNATFKSFVILIPRSPLIKSKVEPLLYATLRNNNYYLVNLKPTSNRSSLKTLSNWIRKRIFSRTSFK